MVTWQPDPADVKAIIPQRLNGEPFSATTVPTADQVSGIIGDVAAEVVGEVGTFDPAAVINPTAAAADQISLAELATRAVALGAASQIEDSFFPEQQTGVGPYGVEQDAGNQHLFARFRRAVENLKAAIDRPGGGQFTGALRTPLPAVEAIKARSL